MNTNAPKNRYQDTKTMVRDYITARGLRMSRNQIEMTAKHVMAAQDGVFTDVSPCRLTYADPTGERATGRPVVWLHQLVQELAA